ncbi:MAG: hypothetical protein LBP62_07530 [Clostridiales bacterium]|jgi:hypothetical protein|nr:hypothetical protein [Clostridiales bacterium]
MTALKGRFPALCRLYITAAFTPYSARSKSLIGIIWFQDINWPGTVPIAKFISANKNYFRDAFLDCMIKAVDEKDDIWYTALFSFFCREFGLGEGVEKKFAEYYDGFVNGKKGKAETADFENWFKKL